MTKNAKVDLRVSQELKDRLIVESRLKGKSVAQTIIDILVNFFQCD